MPGPARTVASALVEGKRWCTTWQRSGSLLPASPSCTCSSTCSGGS